MDIFLPIFSVLGKIIFQMESLSSRYHKNEKVSEGSYGKVYLAVDKYTNEKVALKKMSLESDENGLPTLVVREVVLLKELSSHPNIVTLKDVLYYGNNLYLVFEWFERDLKQYLDAVGKLEPLLVKSYLYQLLQGIRVCHSKKILHRDLKPQNLLIDSRGQLKLADFGLSRGYDFYRRSYTSEVVTLWYRAPEILVEHSNILSEYSTPVDIWSAGCIFAELVSKDPLFPGDSPINQLNVIFSKLGTPSTTSWWPPKNLSENSFPYYPPPVSLPKEVSSLDSEGAQLLRMMLNYEPKLRISAHKALYHPYFNSFIDFLKQQNNSNDLSDWWY